VKREKRRRRKGGVLEKKRERKRQVGSTRPGILSETLPNSVMDRVASYSVMDRVASYSVMDRVASSFNLISSSLKSYKQRIVFIAKE
jgi:hypothetical protein